MSKCSEPRWRNEPQFELSFRSMGRFELRLRGLAGSGWTGRHPRGYRWAQRLLGVLERTVWRDAA